MDHWWLGSHPEGDPVADPIRQSRFDGFIELKPDPMSQLRGDLLVLEHKPGKGTFSQTPARSLGWSSSLSGPDWVQLAQTTVKLVFNTTL